MDGAAETLAEEAMRRDRVRRRAGWMLLATTAIVAMSQAVHAFAGVGF